MQRQVLIFLHMDDRHPGYIADYLDKQQIPYRIIRADQGDAIPPLDGSMAGLVFMGGVMSANDDIPWIKAEIELIRQSLDQGVPLLGHCLGGQLISRALGQEVSTNLVAEVGWHSCYRQSNAAAEDWLGDTIDPFTMFHWHYETFALPAGAQLLFSSQHCQNQAYSYGDNVLAMQGHVEMTEPLLRSWITQWRSHLDECSASVQNHQQIAEDLTANVAALNQVAEQLYQRWASKLSL
ncbi:type 1 glutamine amidotransferase [Porticoccaceae bacterium]|jgi:GMP synthase-like glutamine amidotransferase|nr:type 1 glutamine amidotransferase [Porticoccaceae bacterium]